MRLQRAVIAKFKKLQTTCGAFLLSGGSRLPLNAFCELADAIAAKSKL
jgi:hypothetical protein